jgi:transcriptional regulator
MIDANVKRGSAELAVLSLLEKGPMHGYEIAKRVEQETGGVLKFDVASLYPLLYRMEKQGWVSAEWQDSDSGRRRRCYKLTREGKKQLVPLREQWRSFFAALERLGGFANSACEGAR